MLQEFFGDCIIYQTVWPLESYVHLISIFQGFLKAMNVYKSILM
jgi:hypothetical protein